MQRELSQLIGVVCPSLRHLSAYVVIVPEIVWAVICVVGKALLNKEERDALTVIPFSY
jgi:hypothetical protein